MPMPMPIAYNFLTCYVILFKLHGKPNRFSHDRHKNDDERQPMARENIC